MPLTQLPPLDPSSPTFRADVDTFFRSRIQAFVMEANQLAANLNSIAAGGAYAIPYAVGTDAQLGWGGRLVFSPNGGNQNVATGLLLSVTDTVGSAIQSRMDDMFGAATNLSAIKGHVRIFKMGDPSKWMTFRINQWSFNVTYGYFGVTCVGASSANPFAPDDALILQFQRTGDKGDKGDNGTSLTPMIHVREESAAGAGPATSVTQNTWVKRAFNTVRTNSVTGASLANGQITLPAGTYDYEGNAAGTGCAQHQARLVNVTDNIVASELGTTEYTDSSITTRSVVTGRFVLASTKVFELQHRASSASGSFGSSVSNFGSANVHAEIKLTKVA